LIRDRYPAEIPETSTFILLRFSPFFNFTFLIKKNVFFYTFSDLKMFFGFVKPQKFILELHKLTQN